MNLFREETIIYSKKTPSEISAILKSVTGIFFPSDIEFLGSVSDIGFEIEPVHIGKNSFNPLIKGQFLTTP